MITLRLVNDINQVINYNVDIDDLDDIEFEAVAQDIYLHIWQHWGQKNWQNCVIWHDNKIAGTIVNHDYDFWND